MDRLGRRRGAGGKLNSLPFLARLERAFAGYAPAVAERDPPFREAAVAVTLVPRDQDADLLLLRRATRASDPWSAQIGLPGGRFDEGDASLLETAIRETREETAVELSPDHLVGVLDELRPRTPALPPIIVRPYVLVLPAKPAVIPNAEVAELFWAPLSVLFDPRRVLRTTVEARGMKMTVDAIDFDGRMIWGMTERILRSLGRILDAK